MGSLTLSLSSGPPTQRMRLLPQAAQMSKGNDMSSAGYSISGRFLARPCLMTLLRRFSVKRRSLT
jgi:hypothetical protein